MGGHTVMGRFTILVASAALVLICACGVSLALAQAAPAKAGTGDEHKSTVTAIQLPPAPTPMLPESFDGWVEDGKPAAAYHRPRAGRPGQCRGAEGIRVQRGRVANYKREGETLSLRALRFDDASGAYGAYSYYRQNGWPKEAIGTGAASDNNRVLFWVGTTVVDATFSHVGPMSAGELREIARQLPQPTATARWRRPSWPACLSPSLTRRPRTTQWARPATRAQAACCRRRWSTSTWAPKR